MSVAQIMKNFELVYRCIPAITSTKETAWLCYLAALATQPQAPQGWKLVPIEPTEEMLDAAFDCNALEVAQAVNREKFPEITEPWASNGSVFSIQYVAALRAAPKPETPEVQG